jgi:hypothetical protein
VTTPPEPPLRRHLTISNPAIAHPFAHNSFNKLYLLPEVVGLWNALDHWGYWVRVFGGASIGTQWFGHEVQQGLERVGEVLAVVEGGGWERAMLSEGHGGFQGEVVEVAPKAVAGEDDLGVVGEIEL